LNAIDEKFKIIESTSTVTLTSIPIVQVLCLEVTLSYCTNKKQSTRNEIFFGYFAGGVSTPTRKPIPVGGLRKEAEHISATPQNGRQWKLCCHGHSNQPRRSTAAHLPWGSAAFRGERISRGGSQVVL
jgi:hypothetical protein